MDKMPYDIALSRGGTSHFEFAYNDAATGERIIDTQYASGNLYLASIAIGYDRLGDDDDTITDSETDLIWSQIDSSSDLNRKEAQVWEETKTARYYQDYMSSRLHNAKGLQSILDDIRSPDTTCTAAINSKFNPTSILEEVDQNNYLDSDFANNFYNDGTAYGGMDLPYNASVFSIDTHGNIGGITGKILEMLP